MFNDQFVIFKSKSVFLNIITFTKGGLYCVEKAGWKMIYKRCSNLYRLHLILHFSARVATSSCTSVGPLLSWGLYTLLSTHHAVNSFYKFINIIPFTQSQSTCLTRTYLPTSSHVSIYLLSQSMVYCLSVK